MRPFELLQKAADCSIADITHGRRLQIEGQYDAWFGTPENVMLMKLHYYQDGGSEKHLRDIASFFAGTRFVGRSQLCYRLGEETRCRLKMADGARPIEGPSRMISLGSNNDIAGFECGLHSVT